MCDNRRKCKGRRYDNEERLEDYITANKEIKKLSNMAREIWIKEQCLEMERNLTKNSRKGFETVQKLSEAPKMVVSSTIENASREVLSDPQQVLERWREITAMGLTTTA